jgi:hypothetical protein
MLPNGEHAFEIFGVNMFYVTRAVPKSKDGIAKFLTDHPRYSTGRNLSTYAHNVKLHRLGLSENEVQKASSIMEADDYWSDLNASLREFQNQMNGAYMITPQGRSSGYLVLHEAQVYDPGYKSTCRACGQLNYQEVSMNSCKCGVCGSLRSNLKKPLAWTRVVGSGIDHGVTYQEMLEWSMGDLQCRLDLVRSFDAACDATRTAFKRMLNEYMLVEQTVMVPKKVKRLERIN